MKVDLSQMSYAVISDCGKYRYWLHRRWATGKGWLVFVMLNPSTADGLANDATLRRCIGFAQAFGYKGVIVVNMFAARSRYPDALRDMDDPVGPENDEYITAACEMASRVVVAWGADRMTKRRWRTVIRIIKDAGALPTCFGTTNRGEPLHPLYIAAGTKLKVYENA